LRCNDQQCADKREDFTMPVVTWDHIHLRSPDPEATAAWLHDILGGEILRSPGRIDVKLGGANVFIAPVATGDGQGSRVHEGADHHPAWRAHLLPARPAGNFGGAPGARQEIRVTVS